eukprot:scaffold102_cov340-Pavlova_lutheri.AAC.5
MNRGCPRYRSNGGKISIGWGLDIDRMGARYRSDGGKISIGVGRGVDGGARDPHPVDGRTRESSMPSRQRRGTTRIQDSSENQGNVEVHKQLLHTLQSRHDWKG